MRHEDRRSAAFSLPPPEQRRRRFPLRLAALAPALTVLAGFAGALPLAAQSEVLHLALGDAGRREREVPVTVDAVTDTRTGETLTPDELAHRLAGVRLLFVGESHTDADFHGVELRLLAALAAAGGPGPLLVGLEMYPAGEQRGLDEWGEGLLTEEGFLRLSRWYEHWGYPWAYYRDIFLFARDHRLPLVALNAPRAVVSAVGRQGLRGLSPEQAAQLAPVIDTSNAEQRTLFRASFGGADPLHGGVSPEQFENMFAAQCAWDATMAHHAVAALRAAGPGARMVVLIGAGHVAYGLGVERQAGREFDGPMATLIPVPVRDEEGHPAASVRASYADYLWGLPPTAPPLYPALGLSTSWNAPGGAAGLPVVFVAERSPAEQAGVRVGDAQLAFDGTPLADREAHNRALAAKRWGDDVRLTVRRGQQTLALRVLLRRPGP